MKTSLLLVLSLFFLQFNMAQAGQGDIEAAKARFEEMVKLEAAFDPKVADLYEKGAHIEIQQPGPGGGVYALKLTGEEYQAQVKTLVADSKKAGLVWIYTDVSFDEEGPGVLIRGKRHIGEGQMNSIFNIMMVPNAEGVWRIRLEMGVLAR